jgi:hypothetical protein
MAYVAHQAGRLAEYPREQLDDLHCGAEATYKFPIAITIILEGLFAFLE